MQWIITTLLLMWIVWAETRAGVWKRLSRRWERISRKWERNSAKWRKAAKTYGETADLAMEAVQDSNDFWEKLLERGAVIPKAKDDRYN